MTARAEPSTVLITMPTWLGDIVMATPTLKALAQRWPDASFTLAFKSSIMREVAPTLPIDASSVVWPDVSPSTLRADVAVLLPNSFRAAWHAFRTGSTRRVGYARDRRGWLLTDRLKPLKSQGKFTPVPTVRYYLALAKHLGAQTLDRRVELRIPEGMAKEADALLMKAGLAATNDSDGDSEGDSGGGFVLLNPGAVRASKRWPAERFAQTAQAIHEQTGLPAAVTGSPNERDVLDAVRSAATSPIVDLSAQGLKLGELPAVVKRASLLITNDTGPRHLAAGVGTPTVTLYGPTPPSWTVLDDPPPHRDLVAGSPTPQAGSSKTAVAGQEMDRIAVDQVTAAALELLNDAHCNRD